MSDTHSHQTAFVRAETLPPMAPPVSEQGIVKWLRENLFATPANSALTVVTLFAIWFVLKSTMPWIFNGVWNTGSLAECREVLDGVAGACFSVLTERWNQLLFGFKYPPELYWRPMLAFCIMLVAMAPVLFFDLPRKLLIVTALFPFIAFWLIWGGTIWTPVMALVGVVVGYLVYSRFVARNFALGFFGGVVAAIITWNLGGYVVDAIAPEEPFLQAIPSRDLGGYMLNMMLGVTCVSLSIPLGIALALGRQSSMPLIKYICVIFIEFIRGVPLITLLFVANVMLAYFFPPGSGVDLFLRVVIMITMFDAADHSASGAQDLHSGHREHRGGSVQRHDAGLHHFDV